MSDSSPSSASKFGKLNPLIAKTNNFVSVLQSVSEQSREKVKTGLLSHTLGSMGPLGQKLAPIFGVKLPHFSLAESSFMWRSMFGSDESAVPFDRFSAVLREFIDASESTVRFVRYFVPDPVTADSFCELLKAFGPLPSLMHNLRRFATLPLYPMTPEEAVLALEPYVARTFVVRVETGSSRCFVAWREDGSQCAVREQPLVPHTSSYGLKIVDYEAAASGSSCSLTNSSGSNSALMQESLSASTSVPPSAANPSYGNLITADRSSSSGALVGTPPPPPPLTYQSSTAPTAAPSTPSTGATPISLEWIQAHPAGLWRTPVRCEWLDDPIYHGSIELQDVGRLLAQPGAFLLRVSTTSTPPRLVLSVRVGVPPSHAAITGASDPTIGHYELLLQRPGEFLDLSLQRRFNSFNDLLTARGLHATGGVRCPTRLEYARVRAELLSSTVPESGALDCYRMAYRWGEFVESKRHLRVAVLPLVSDASEPAQTHTQQREVLHNFCQAFSRILPPPPIEPNPEAGSLPPTPAMVVISQIRNRLPARGTLERESSSGSILSGSASHVPTSIGAAAAPPSPAAGSGSPRPLSPRGGTGGSTAARLYTTNTSTSSTSSSSSAGSGTPPPFTTASSSPTMFTATSSRSSSDVSLSSSSTAAAAAAAATAKTPTAASVTAVPQPSRGRQLRTAALHVNVFRAAVNPPPSVSTTGSVGSLWAVAEEQAPAFLRVGLASFELNKPKLVDLNSATARLAAFCADMQKLRDSSPGGTASLHMVRHQVRLQRHLFVSKLALCRLLSAVRCLVANLESVSRNADAATAARICSSLLVSASTTANESAVALVVGFIDMLFSLEPQHILTVIRPLLAISIAAHSSLQQARALLASAANSVATITATSAATSTELTPSASSSSSSSSSPPSITPPSVSSAQHRSPFAELQTALDDFTDAGLRLLHCMQESFTVASTHETRHVSVWEQVRADASQLRAEMHQLSSVLSNEARAAASGHDTSDVFRQAASAVSNRWRLISERLSALPERVQVCLPTTAVEPLSDKLLAATQPPDSRKARERARSLLERLETLVHWFEVFDFCVLVQLQRPAVSFQGDVYVETLNSIETVSIELLDGSAVSQTVLQNLILPNVDAVIIHAHRTSTASQLQENLARVRRICNPDESSSGAGNSGNSSNTKRPSSSSSGTPPTHAATSPHQVASPSLSSSNLVSSSSAQASPGTPPASSSPAGSTLARTSSLALQVAERVKSNADLSISAFTKLGRTSFRPPAQLPVVTFVCAADSDVLEESNASQPPDPGPHLPADSADDQLRTFTVSPFFPGTIGLVLGELALAQYGELNDRLFLRHASQEKKGKLVLPLHRLHNPERLCFARFGYEALHSLTLEDNMLTELPPFLCTDMRGKSVSKVTMERNRLPVFPLELAALRIRKLSLANNQIEVLPPDIRLFTTLEQLNISHNRLNYLPAELSELTTLKHLRVDGNPLETIPPEVLRNGTRALLTFLKNLKSPTAKWKRLKLVFVGEENVGKTSLLNCFNPKKPRVVKKAGGTTDTISTNGVDIDEIALDKDVEFSAWDFGGQEVFYPTHTFFLSDRALYLLCFNLERVNQSRLEYWLKQIKMQRKTASSPGPSVYLIGTHADAFPSREAAEQLLQRVEAQYRSAYNVRASVAVSCTTKSGLKELTHVLRTDALKQKLLSQLIPGSWQNLANYVTKQKAREATLSWSEFQLIARECGVLEEDIPSAVSFLNDVGMLVHFASARGINDLVILDPQFLSDVMASVVTFKHKLVKNGIMLHSDLPQIWSRYPPSLHDGLLQLLENFEIALRIKTASPPQSLVPCLLPLTKPDVASFGWTPFLPDRSRLIQVGRLWRFSFLPIGFMGRLIARFLHHGDVTLRCVWANGMLVESGGQLALFQHVNEDSSLCVLVRQHVARHLEQSASRSLLIVALEAIDSLLNAYRMSDTPKFVPCSHCFQLRNPLQEVYNFSFDECAAALATGSSFVFCRGVPTRPVRLDLLAPDLSFSNVPLLSDVQVLEKLGEGGFGVVYRGLLRDGEEVAIKQMNVTMTAGNRSELIAEFQAEVFIMASLDHPNIVSLHGIMLNPLRMVMEFVRGGDLYKWLHPKGGPAPSADNERYKLRVALDMSKGLQYLQSITPPVIHRDLRSPNVYLASYSVDDQVVAKVADFGLAQRVAPYVIGHLPTWRWAAPETFDSSVKQYDERADLYSFGIVLWELVTRKKPFREFEDRYDDFAMQRAVIGAGLRPTIPETVQVPYREIIEACWQAQPEKRMHINEIVARFEKALGVQPSSGVDGRASSTAVNTPSTELKKEGKSSIERKATRWKAAQAAAHRPTATGAGVASSTADANASDAPAAALSPASSSSSSSASSSASSLTESPPARPEAQAKARSRSAALRLRWKLKLSAECKFVTCMSSVGAQLWSGCVGGQIVVCDLAAANAKNAPPSVVPVAPAHNSRVCALLRVGATSVWSAGEDGSISVWNTATRTREASLKHAVTVSSSSSSPPDPLRVLCSVSPAGAKTDAKSSAPSASAEGEVWSVDGGGGVCVWVVGHTKPIATLRLPDLEAVTCAVQVDDAVWFGTRRRMLVHVDVKSREAARVWTLDAAVNHLLWLPAASRLICATQQSALQVLNKKGEILKRLEGHESKVTQLLQVPQHGIICSGAFDTSVLVWDEKTYSCVDELRGEHQDVIKALVLVVSDPNHSFVCSAGGDVDGQICFWSIVQPTEAQ